MEYRVLVLKPYIVEEKAPDNILWKAQLDTPKDYESVSSVMLKDYIEKNNRRSLNQWENLIEYVGLKYDLKYDHKYTREYSIKDIDLMLFYIQLFCCDISVYNYAVEVHEEEILNFLSSLKLKNKEGLINPTALNYRLIEARETFTLNNIKNPIISGLFFILEKLILHCVDYESDILYKIEHRKMV